MTYLVFFGYEVKENAEYIKKRIKQELGLEPDIVWVLTEEWLNLVNKAEGEKKP